jgi:hypothetical protein
MDRATQVIRTCQVLVVSFQLDRATTVERLSSMMLVGWPTLLDPRFYAARSARPRLPSDPFPRTPSSSRANGDALALAPARKARAISPARITAFNFSSAGSAKSATAPRIVDTMARFSGGTPRRSCPHFSRRCFLLFCAPVYLWPYFSSETGAEYGVGFFRKARLLWTMYRNRFRT